MSVSPEALRELQEYAEAKAAEERRAHAENKTTMAAARIREHQRSVLRNTNRKERRRIAADIRALERGRYPNR